MTRRAPPLVVTAIQKAISDGVVGIVANSPVFFLGAKYAQEAGIPVTGGCRRRLGVGHTALHQHVPGGHEQHEATVPWTTRPRSIFKQYGGTVLGTYGYGISPCSTHATYGAAKSALAAGLKVGVMDASVPFGSESFSTQALAAKSARVEALTPPMDVNSDIALLAALNQNGVHPKVKLFATGYEDSLAGSQRRPTVQGALFATSASGPGNMPHNAGDRSDQAAFRKYGRFKGSPVPRLRPRESWLGLTS